MAILNCPRKIPGIPDIPETGFTTMTDLLEKFNAVHNPKAIFEAECTQMFDNAMMALNEKYQPGTFDYVDTNHKELYQKIEELESELHKCWENDIQAFRNILTLYYRAVLNCIKVYKEHQPFMPTGGMPESSQHGVKLGG